MRSAQGLPDLAINADNSMNPVGNCGIIDFGSEEYGFFTHLQQGSVRVAKGAVVTAGQEIGLCGKAVTHPSRISTFTGRQTRAGAR